MGWQGRKFHAGICLALFLMRGLFNLAADVDLLLDFKRTVVTRDPLSVLTSWTCSNRQNYCTWYGIACGRDASITWVDSISITSCQLEFTMWDGFAAFSRLRYINFSDNSVSGSIPSRLGSLKSIVSLDLSSNQLFGSVPSTFNNLSSLETLILGSNNIVGAVPNSLCRSTSLRILDMSFNKLTECLTGHLLCREAEIYSYGIFLLEMITRKKPMASGLAVDKNLYAWVQKRFPAKGIEVADPQLLSTTYNPESLLSFIYLALSCVEQSQENRPNINDVVITLQQLKTAELEARSIQSVNESSI